MQTSRASTKKLIRHLLSTAILCGAGIVTTVQAQSDPATTFKTNCAPCHGVNGSGDTQAGKAVKAKDLRSDEVQGMGAGEIAQVITNGNGKMPAFGSKLAPEDIKKLAAYVRTLGKGK